MLENDKSPMQLAGIPCQESQWMRYIHLISQAN